MKRYSFDCQVPYFYARLERRGLSLRVVGPYCLRIKWLHNNLQELATAECLPGCTNLKGEPDLPELASPLPCRLAPKVACGRVTSSAQSLVFEQLLRCTNRGIGSRQHGLDMSLDGSWLLISLVMIAGNYFVARYRRLL